MKSVTFIQLDGQLIPRSYFREKEINVTGDFRGFPDSYFFQIARNVNEQDSVITKLTPIIKPKI